MIARYSAEGPRSQHPNREDASAGSGKDPRLSMAYTAGLAWLREFGKAGVGSRPHPALDEETGARKRGCATRVLVYWPGGRDAPAFAV